MGEQVRLERSPQHTLAHSSARISLHAHYKPSALQTYRSLEIPLRPRRVWIAHPLDRVWIAHPLDRALTHLTEHSLT